MLTPVLGQQAANRSGLAAFGEATRSWPGHAKSMSQPLELSPGCVRSFVPMAHVASVPTAIEFYGHLGFRVENTFVPVEGEDPAWAYLASGRAHLMVNRADGPVDSGQQAVLFYAYFDDTAAARDKLTGAGVECGPIEYPFWAPRGEFRIVDPDGYVVMVTHVGE